MAESLCALRHLLRWDAVNPRAAKAVADGLVLNPSAHAARTGDARIDDLVEWDAKLYALADARLDATLRHEVPAGLCPALPS